MKYYIIATFEMDGHSSAMSMLCDSAAAKQGYLKSLLYDKELNTWYPTSYKTQEDGAEIWYGEWDCGEWSIKIIPFKTFKELCNKEYFTRTG